MLGDGPARSAPAGGSLPPMEIPERIAAYALTFAPDDHHTGIYPFDRLRSLGRSAGGTA